MREITEQEILEIATALAYEITDDESCIRYEPQKGWFVLIDTDEEVWKAVSHEEFLEEYAEDMLKSMCRHNVYLATQVLKDPTEVEKWRKYSEYVTYAVVREIVIKVAEEILKRGEEFGLERKSPPTRWRGVKEKLLIFCDGACEPHNPGGAAAWGFAAVDTETGEVLHQASGVAAVGNGATNNLAEFAAVGAALQWLLEREFERTTIRICTDSQLVVNILKKEWQANPEAGYYAEYKQTKDLLKQVRWRGNQVEIKWIPREENTLADKLSKIAAFQAYPWHTDRKRLRFFALKRATDCFICSKPLEVGEEVVGIPLRGGVWKIFCKQHLNENTEEVSNNTCEGVQAEELSTVC